MLVEISFTYRLVNDYALNVAVLQLQIAVCPVVENYSLSDLAFFFELFYILAACCSDLACESHVARYSVDAFNIAVSSYEEHELALEVCLTKVYLFSTVTCQFVHSCADDVALVGLESRDKRIEFHVHELDRKTLVLSDRIHHVDVEAFDLFFAVLCELERFECCVRYDLESAAVVYSASCALSAVRTAASCKRECQRHHECQYTY